MNPFIQLSEVSDESKCPIFIGITKNVTYRPKSVSNLLIAPISSNIDTYLFNVERYILRII